MPQSLHAQMLDQIRSYFLVGGMPEAVREWVESHDYIECSRIHHDLLETYQDDFSKYKSRISPIILSNTLKSITLEAGNKFIYNQVENGASTNTIKEALSLLSLAGLAIPVPHTAAKGLPLGADINLKFQKYLFIDIGLMQALLGLKPNDILLSNETDFINKGGLAEMFVGLEIIKYSQCYHRPECYYWQRTDNNGQAEVDYVITKNHQIIPVEVKAGTRGSMQSMYSFMDKKKSKYGIRTCLENFIQYIQ